MKLKTNFKILFVLGMIFVIMILLCHSNIVEAETTETTVNLEKVNNDIEWISDITCTSFISEIEDDPYYKILHQSNITMKLNEKFTLEKFKADQEYMKNNNINKLIQKVYFDIPDNVKEVRDDIYSSDNNTYPILDNNGDKYIELNIEVAKIFSSVNEVITYYEQQMYGGVLEIDNSFGLEYVTLDDEIEKSNISCKLDDPFQLYYSITECGSMIADENGKIDKFKTTEATYGEGYAVSEYVMFLRRYDYFDTFEPAQTNISYLNEYIYLAFPYYIGENIEVEIDETNETISFEYYGEHSADNYLINMEAYANHIYRIKINLELENKFFSKPQTINLIYEEYDEGFELPHIFKFPINVKGIERTTVKVNDNSEVEIDFSGVLPIGVSIKSDNIEEGTEIYTTLTTTGINNLKNQFNVNNLTYLTLHEIYTVGGEIDGAIQLTFDVGKQYNGKYVFIAHRKNDGEYECFREIVENGKVTIVVYELSPFIVAVERKEYKLGDVNRDNNITLADYTKILAHVKKTQLLTGDELKAADVNGDGKVTLADYTKVLAHVKKTALLD